MKIINEFKEFITKGNAFDLAVGVIIGSAFTPVVTSMVKDVIMPVVSLGLGKTDFTNLYLPLTAKGIEMVKVALESGASLPSLKVMQDANCTVLSYGLFINTLVSFFFLMLGVFALIKIVNAIRRPAPQAVEAPAPPTPSDEVVLLKEIRDLLKK